MPITLPTALLVGGGLSAAGGVASGILGSNAAGDAANAQAGAANNAAQISRQNAIDSLNFQKQIYGNSLQMGAPGVAAGTGALSKLSYLLGIPGVSGLSQSSVANGFGSQQPQGPQIPGGLKAFLQNGGDLSSIPPSNPAAGSTNQIARPMMANGAQIPASGGGSAFVGNGSTAANGGSNFNTINGIGPISGGTAQLPPGGFSGGTTAPLSGGGNILQSLLPGEAGSPGGPTGTGFIPGQTGIQQANGGGSAQIPFDPNASGSTAGGFGSLLQPYGKTFSSPTDVTEQNDPGYKFRIQQGLDALQNSAAARGGLESGGTAKALNDYAQNSASSEYGNVYNREFNNFQTGYNQYNNDQNNQFNRLASLAGMGQTSVGQLNSSGASAAGNVGNILLGSAGQQGPDLTNAGSARGSGFINQANALGGGLNSALGGVGSSLDLLALLQKQGGGSNLFM